MNLQTPDTIRRLQRKLYLKAKAEPDYRFYLLYDKIYREDILHQAYDLMRSNNGAPGVDGVTFEMIEAEGLEEWLSDIRKDLPGPASQGANAWHPPLHIYSGVRRARGAPAQPAPPRHNAVCLGVKPVGERSAGNSHAAFDERGRETGSRQAKPAPFLDSTICRSTSSAAVICWRRSCGRPTSTARRARWRKWRGLSPRSGRVGRRHASCCGQTPALPARN